METKLDGLGYYDGTLRVSTHGTTTAQLTAFDAAAKENRETPQTLKRNYVIKLFADHACMQSLFASLAKDLERLIG